VRRGGTGLGLAIARRLIQLMGGELGVASHPGLGSRFYFVLPLVHVQPPSRNRGVVDNDDAVACSVHAMVVDDVLENRNVLVDMLKLGGCRVTTAVDAVTALCKLDEAHAAGDMPDVIFMDITMPGMSGIEAAGEIHRRFGVEAPPLAATTASAFMHNHAEYLRAGFRDVIVKPLRSERVYLSITMLAGQTVHWPTLSDTQSATVEGATQNWPSHAPGPNGGSAELAIPEPLRKRLQGAAELCEVTDLKAAVDELQQLGPAAQAMSQQIRRNLQSYDMEEILRLLSTPDPHDRDSHPVESPGGGR